jgi:hypothetical protein
VPGSYLGHRAGPAPASGTIRALAEALQAGTSRASDAGETAGKITGCDRKLAQCRAALDSVASPATIAAWIAETETEKAPYTLATRRTAASA